MGGTTDKNPTIARSYRWIVMLGAAWLSVSAIVFVANGADGSSAQAAGNGQEVCGGLNSGKIDTSGDPGTVTMIAPSGQEIYQYCIKAGSDQANGGTCSVCVIAVDPAVNSITRGHPTGKAVSHYSFAYRPVVTTTPTTPPTDPPVPTVVPTDPPVPTVVPTDPPVPTVVPTDPPVPTVVPTDPPVPTVVPTDPPVPTVVPTDPTVPTSTDNAPGVTDPVATTDAPTTTENAPPPTEAPITTAPTDTVPGSGTTSTSVPTTLEPTDGTTPDTSVAPPADPSGDDPQPEPTTNLPATGGTALPITAAALSALFAGLALVMAARRRADDDHIAA